MPYQHDVFISYKRDRFADEWLINCFLPIFRFKVQQAIAAETNRKPGSIFFDQTDIAPAQLAFDHEGIEPGQNWRDALTRAIRTSRCAVALWSPLYFQSEWCNIEWRSFYERGKSFNPSKELVIPASIYDGKVFPNDARATQFIDLSEFVVIGTAFKNTELYVQLQKKLDGFAQRVAEVVAQAPAFDNWAVAAPPPAPPPPDIPKPVL
jgi:hypothetical protein